MTRYAAWPIATLVAVTAAVLAGCDGRGGSSVDGVAAVDDAAFAAMQERGRQAMGVDQYTSTHVFEALPDGGRIELQRDVDDAEGAERIRRHLQAIARLFDGGDFSTPAFVHIESIPGASAMAEKRDAITYTFSQLPRGGEVRITTEDPEALEAIHEFFAFQREAHRAGGRAHGPHGPHGADMSHPPREPRDLHEDSPHGRGGSDGRGP